MSLVWCTCRYVQVCVCVYFCIYNVHVCCYDVCILNSNLLECVCVCLATLQGWKPPFSLDVENFSFTPRLQPLNELEVILSVETSIYIVHVQVYIHY